MPIQDAVDRVNQFKADSITKKIKQAQQDLAERIRAEEELREVNQERARRVRELGLLNQVITASTSKLEPKSVLEAVCQELAQGFGLCQAAAALFAESGSRTALTVVAEYTPEDNPSAIGHVIPIEDNPATQYVLEHKAPVAVIDAQHDRHHHNFLNQYMNCNQQK